jgi:hypothetical protein
MLTHTPSQSGLSPSMRRGAQFLVGGLGVTIVLLSAIIGLEVSVATARSGVEASGQTVNRTQKRDRLPLVPAFHRNAVNQLLEVPRSPNADSELADGCESLVSPLAHSPWANVAGRCVS